MRTIALATLLLMGCYPETLPNEMSTYAIECQPYGGDDVTVAQHTERPEYFVAHGREVSRVLARVPIHNPTDEPLEVDVVCHFHVDHWLSGTNDILGVRVCPRTSSEVNVLWGGVFDESNDVWAVCVTMTAGDHDRVIYVKEGIER
jgi:hypothetical protein